MNGAGSCGIYYKIKLLISRLVSIRGACAYFEHYSLGGKPMEISNWRDWAVDLCGKAGLVLAPSAVGVAEAKTVVVQKSAIYVSALPKGAVKMTFGGGIVVWKCGSLYYQPDNGRYVRVDIKSSETTARRPVLVHAI